MQSRILDVEIEAEKDTDVELIKDTKAKPIEDVEDTEQQMQNRQKMQKTQKMKANVGDIEA